MRLPLFRKLTADRRGATAIMIALMAAALIAFASLGVEVVLALQTQRTMQSAADSAAISAANAQIVAGETNTGCVSGSACVEEAYALAAKAGYSSGQTTTCTSTSPQVYVGPPCDGPNAGSSGYVEVKIEAPFMLALAHVIFPGNFTLHGRAVAYIPAGASAHVCTLALQPNVAGLTIRGTSGTYNYSNCSVSVNGSVYITGHPTFCAAAFYVGQGTFPSTFDTSSTTCPGSTTSCAGSPSNPNCVTGAPLALNPWANTPVPSVSPGTVNKSGVATPGSYSGTTLSSASELCPGVYVVSGSISLHGNSSLASVAGSTAGCPAATASLPAGVTIFSTGSLGGGNGSWSITLTAQTEAALESEGYSAALSQDYAGVAFYSTATGDSGAGGSGTFNVTGVIVVPNQTLSFNGTPAVTGSTCLEAVAATLSFNGDNALGANCLGFYTNPNDAKYIQQPAVLVE